MDNNLMPPTKDEDFLQVLDCCDPTSTKNGWETLFSWSPTPEVDAWLAGFRAARAALAT